MAIVLDADEAIRFPIGAQGAAAIYTSNGPWAVLRDIGIRARSWLLVALPGSLLMATAAERPSAGIGLELALIVASASALGGCIFFKPSPGEDDVVRQALPKTTVVPPAWSAVASTPGLLGNDWLADFHDAELEELVRLALANNPDLGVAASWFQRAQQVVQQVGGQLLPSVGGKATGSGTVNFGSGTFGSIGAVLGVVWEADVWGKLTSEKESAAASESATAMDYAYAVQSRGGDGEELVHRD